MILPSPGQPLGERSPAVLNLVIPVWFHEGLKRRLLGVDAYIVEVVAETMQAWGV